MYNINMKVSASNVGSVASQDPLWYGAQDANGVDLSLIRENLKLTPRERLLQGDRARQSALRLLHYGRRQREQNARSK
jgi:hypothetical protein